MIKKIDLISLNYIECYGFNYTFIGLHIIHCYQTIPYLYKFRKNIKLFESIQMCFNSEQLIFNL